MEAILKFLVFIVIAIILFATGFLDIVVAMILYFGGIALCVVFWIVVVIIVLWILNEIFN